MSEEKEVQQECTHDCSTCSQACASKAQAPVYEKLNQYSKVGKVVGVVSGKGGVGKSLVSSLLAVELSRRDETVAILDADITGPSRPKAFGLDGLCEAAPLVFRHEAVYDVVRVDGLDAHLAEVTRKEGFAAGNPSRQADFLHLSLFRLHLGPRVRDHGGVRIDVLASHVDLARRHEDDEVALVGPL